MLSKPAQALTLSCPNCKNLKIGWPDLYWIGLCTVLNSTLCTLILCYTDQFRLWLWAIQISSDFDSVLSWSVQTLTLCYPDQFRHWLCAIQISSDFDSGLSRPVQTLTLSYPDQFRLWLCAIQISSEFDSELSRSVQTLTLACCKGHYHILFLIVLNLLRWKSLL